MTSLQYKMSVQMKDFNHGTEQHKLKIHLIFHQVQLTVKFQCHIVLALKNQYNKIVSQTVPKPLSQGKCEISQQMLVDWEAQYNSVMGQYLTSNLEIFVLVHATNGVIHAGLCTIDVTKSLHQAVLPLKKCSDKTATLTLTCTAQYSQTTLKNKNYVEFNYDGESRSAYQSREKKINRLKSQQNKFSESQYNQSVLSMSKISIASNKKMQNYLRAENQELTKQNDELRQKLKWLQRKQKQGFQQLKECMLKMQKLSNRCTEAEGLNELNEMLLMEKEKCIKSYQNQINRLEQVKKDYFQQINALEQKIFSKEESFSKQSEKYSEKILKLEEQLQKVTSSYAIALNKYDQFEKNSSNVSKQKQKNFQIEKAKNIKQIKQLQQINAKFEDQIRNYKAKITQLEHILQKSKYNESFALQIRQKDQKIQKLNIQLQKIKKEKLQIEEELDQMRIGQEDRLSLKKKTTQVQSQCNNYKNQLQKLSQNQLSFQRKIEQLNASYDKLQVEKKELLISLETLKSQLSFKTTQLLKQQKEHNMLKEKYSQLQGFAQNSRIKEQTLLSQQRKEINALKDQLQTIKSQKQLLVLERGDLQQNFKKISLEKEVLQNEIKQQKYLLQSYEKSIQELKSETSYCQQSLMNTQKQHQNQTYLFSDLIKWLIEVIPGETPAEYSKIGQISDEYLKQQLSKSIKNRNHVIEKRKKDYESLLQQKTFIEMQLQKLGRRYDECEQYYEEQLHKQQQEKEAELKEYIQQKNKLLEVIMQMQSQKLHLSSLKQQYYKQSKLLEHRAQQNEKDIETLKNTIKHLEQNLKKQHQNLIQMTNYYEKLFGHKNMQNQQLQSQKQKLWQIQKEKNEVLVSTLKEILKNKEQELKDAIKVNQQLQQRLRKNESETKKLQFDLSVQLHLYGQLQAKVNHLSIQNSQLKNDLRELQTQIQRKQKHLSQKQIDLKENSAKSIELEDRFQQTIVELQQKRQELERSLQSKNYQISQWKYKIKLLEDQNSKQKKQFLQEINKLTQDLSIYKILIEQAQNTIARLQKQNQVMKMQAILRSSALQSAND